MSKLQLSIGARLGGWQRIGIVASVVWVLGAGLVTRIDDVRSAQSGSNLSYEVCMDNLKGQRHADFSECRDEAWKAYKVYIEHSWGNVAIVAFGPLPFFWLIAWVIRATYRWIRRGFD